MRKCAAATSALLLSLALAPALAVVPTTEVAAAADDFLAALADTAARPMPAASSRMSPWPWPGHPDPFEGKALVMHVRECGGNAAFPSTSATIARGRGSSRAPTAACA